jgi:hypothetical protein
MRTAGRKRRKHIGRAALPLAIALAGVKLISVDAASAYYVGPSYLKVSGLGGGARQSPFEDWVRAEAYYWGERPQLREIRGTTAPKNDLLFTGPRAPEKGPGMLALSVDKSSPALKPLMEACHSGARIVEVTFAESSELERHPQEHGPRPSDVPDYYEYGLKGVSLTCPVIANAPEQALTVHFDQIEWLNYRPQPMPRAISAEPARLPPAPLSGASKVFVISWFAAVADSRDDQCPRMNTKPSQEDYYALMSKERAAAQRAFLADKGGANTTYLPYRGPDEMNATLLPGIVADPGHVAPEADVVQGFDLDGDDGSGPPPPHIRKHKNFVSPDGRSGIDNQLFTVEGCVEGFRRKGFLPMIFNESRRSGRPTALIEISGIDDERNDNDVAITIFYSTDDFRRSPTKVVLPDFTYRVTEDPEFTQDFARFRGKIVNGIVTTDPLQQLHIHEMLGIETTFIQPRLRLAILPDGTMKGVIGGYLDWRQRLAWQIFRSSDYENTIGFQVPAIYNAMKRAADGLQDPVTGEFNGISAAFEIEGVPAFIPPAQHRQLLAGVAIRHSQRK